MRRLHPAVLAVLSFVMLALPAGAQAPSVAAMDTAPPAVQREFRAAWVATVGNMDWPSKRGLSSADQQRELIAILDKLVALRMNAIVLQVRPAGDAFYASKIEPWSDFLTGQMGRAPNPYYDPLAFAIAEAHKRGIELHAWINPYRAKDPSTKNVSSTHISKANPELVRKYGEFLWMDPGDPKVRARTEKVVLDLVRRYDVDAIHMDDYFYPYREIKRHKEIPFPDNVTWSRYKKAGGTLARDDWRRDNVNRLVKELYEDIHKEKPWVRFGISPFGIWRPGYPASVRGMDQYTEIYADARKWINEGWVDYFSPQLYWSVDKQQQSYHDLLEWWTQENVKGRNIWPGNYTGKVGFTNSSKWRTDEVLEQIRLTRAQPGATGNVHFSMNVFMQDPDSLNERLVNETYASPALVPASSWLDKRAPAAPAIRVRTDSTTGQTVLEMTPGAPAVWLWVVQSKSDGAWITAILPGSDRSRILGARGEKPPLDVRVTAIDRVGNASAVSRVAPAR
ncbi:MAG: family 10 glycosylhydrolase [bacterium]